MRQSDAVAAARLAMRLAGQVERLTGGWSVAHARLRAVAGHGVIDTADAAVGRLLAVLEAEIDRLCLLALAGARTRGGVVVSPPVPGRLPADGYPAVAEQIAEQFDLMRWRGFRWSRRGRHYRRLARDLRSSAELLARTRRARCWVS